MGVEDGWAVAKKKNITRGKQDTISTLVSSSHPHIHIVIPETEKANMSDSSVPPTTQAQESKRTQKAVIPQQPKRVEKLLACVLPFHHRNVLLTLYCRIPGPVELSPNVLQAMALPPLSHVSPEFVSIMQESLALTRQLVRAPPSTPVFLLAGSGTLGWEQVGANLIQQGDRVLVLKTGYFGVGFGECLEAYGAQVEFVDAEQVGGPVSLDVVRDRVRKGGYRMVTITHVDTSTGVLSDVRAISKVVKEECGSETLVVVDAVCSLASEEFDMNGWDVDVVFSASQKGLGAPPGLSVCLASTRARKVYESIHSNSSRKTGGYYASWKKWLPIMNAYSSGSPAYFGTPPVTLVRAYHASLKEILKSGLSTRLQKTSLASARVKSTLESWGYTQLPTHPEARANGMTAVFLPRSMLDKGVKAGDVMKEAGRRGVVVAGGLVDGIKDKYIRIGHMGWGVQDGSMLDQVLAALNPALTRLGDAGRL